MSRVHVFFDGGDRWLECWAGTRTDMAAVVRICQIMPSQPWDELIASVREHQAKHGCGDEGRGGGPLDDTQRWQVEKARDCLGTWDLARGDNVGIDRERVLADQLRTMLAVIDQVAPKEADR